MAEIVTIRPKEGSRKFATMNGQVTQFQRVVDEHGNEVDRASGQYKSERFPNSRQSKRPKWSMSKRRWRLKGFEEMTHKKQIELNELVAACKFQYGQDHPNYKQYIKEADVYDRKDPFFIHKDLRVVTKEGEISLNMNSPIDKVLHLYFQTDAEFQVGGENVNPIMSSRVRYIITDKNIDVEIKKKTREGSIKATELYNGLNDDKKGKVAMALGLISSETTDRALVDEVLWDYSQDNATTVANNKTKQEMFIAMCEAKNEVLNTRHMIQKAKASGKLKRSKTQGWLLFGEPIGTTEAKILQYFNDPVNQEMLIRLEQALENDKGN